MPKLTLSADERTIEAAKRIADERGTSVSAMFSAFIESINASERRTPTAAPITGRVRGLAKVSDKLTDRELFERAILAKSHR